MKEHLKLTLEGRFIYVARSLRTARSYESAHNDKNAEPRGKRFWDQRERLQLTRSKLAKHLGCDVKMIRLYEAGAHMSFHTLADLRRIGFDVDYVMTGPRRS